MYYLIVLQIRGPRIKMLTRLHNFGVLFCIVQFLWATGVFWFVSALDPLHPLSRVPAPSLNLLLIPPFIRTTVITVTLR